MKKVAFNLILLALILTSCNPIKEVDDKLVLSQDRSIIVIQKNYLSEDEILKIGRLIEEGISDLVNEAGSTKIRSIYPIEVNISATNGLSSSDGNKITLSYVKEGYSLYIHELTHSLFGLHKYTWLSEGFSEYMQEKYSKTEPQPWANTPIDNFCSYLLSLNNENVNKALSKIGGKLNITLRKNVLSEEEIRAFYAFSKSFVTYIINKVGNEKFLKIYNDLDSSKKIIEVTGKDLQKWKLDWLDYISTIEGMNNSKPGNMNLTTSSSL